MNVESFWGMLTHEHMCSFLLQFCYGLFTQLHTDQLINCPFTYIYTIRLKMYCFNHIEYRFSTFFAKPLIQIFFAMFTENNHTTMFLIYSVCWIYSFNRNTYEWVFMLCFVRVFLFFRSNFLAEIKSNAKRWKSYRKLTESNLNSMAVGIQEVREIGFTFCIDFRLCHCVECHDLLS